MPISFLRPRLAILLGLLLAPAATGALAQTIPPALGWHELRGTALQAVCPPNGFGGSGYGFTDSCRNVTGAWNSGVMDTRRNRLIVWGGGHSDYLGNEVYALDLNSLTVHRLTDPGLPVAEKCPEAIVNGTQPNSRHTYDALAYMANVDRMWAFGGSLATCGSFGRDTWTFDLATLTWEKRNPSGDIPTAGPGIVSAYDTSSGKVFLHDGSGLYEYDFHRDRYRGLAGSSGMGYHSTAVIDPVRRKFVIVGVGRVHVFDIGSSGFFGPRHRIVDTKGGEPIVTSAYPGLAYDPVTDRIVAWNGGDSVYSLNLDTATWTPTTHPGGPGAPVRRGTYKRWSYSPASQAFVLVNAMSSNAFVFRLTPAGTSQIRGSGGTPAR